MRYLSLLEGIVIFSLLREQQRKEAINQSTGMKKDKKFVSYKYCYHYVQKELIILGAIEKSSILLSQNKKKDVSHFQQSQFQVKKLGAMQSLQTSFLCRFRIWHQICPTQPILAGNRPQSLAYQPPLRGQHSGCSVWI